MVDDSTLDSASSRTEPEAGPGEESDRVVQQTLDNVTPQDWGALIAVLGGAALVWLYFTGWAFAYAYFDLFHLPLLLADVPRDHIMAYGFWVLRGSVWVIVAVIALAGLIVLRRLPALWSRMPKDVRPAWIMALMAAVIGLFPLGYYQAFAVAIHRVTTERAEGFRSFPRVILEVANGETTPDMKNGCYRLLLHTGTVVALIRPLRDVPQADLPTIVLPADSVQWMKIKPSYTSCE